MIRSAFLKKIKHFNHKAKTLKKIVAYTSTIDNDDIKQKSIKMISNGKKTKVQIYTRNNANIIKKNMQFDNNKLNLAKLLKVDPVVEDLNTRLYNDFFKSNNVNFKSKLKPKKNKNKKQTKSSTKKNIKNTNKNFTKNKKKKKK
jgi:hypothetical protein